MNQNHDKNNIEDEIRGNEERIAALEKKLEESLGSNEDLKDSINDLQKEIQDLKDENELLRKQLQEMEKKMMDSKKETSKQLQEMEARLENLEKENKYQKAVFIIVQIGNATQRNMCKYVLRKHFDDSTLYKFKEIEWHISNLKSEADKKAARKRLTEMNKKISWDQRLVNRIRSLLNQTRIGYAHPDLNSEKIQEATVFLKKENILDEGMVHNVNELTKQWVTSEGLLNRAAGGPEDGPEGGTRNLSTAEQSQYTYARWATGGRYLHTKA